MNIYLVLDNRYGDNSPIWSDKSKAFLDRIPAMKYRYELLNSEELRSTWINIYPPDMTKSPDEWGPYIIKEVWCDASPT